MAEAVLVPFIFSVDDSYVLEVGDGYVRFIRRQAQITVADTDASITNGTFASDVSGWTDQSTGSASISHSSAQGGEMSLDGAIGAVAWAEQSVSTSDTDTEHVLRFKARAVPGLKVKVQVGSSSTGEELFAETALGVAYGNSAGAVWSYHTIAFTPAASPFYVQFKNDNDILGAAEDVLIDDVSILDNTPLEIGAPWAEADLDELKWVQSGDVVYFTHPDFPTYKLERRGHSTWSLVQVYWVDGPWNEINEGTDVNNHQLVDNPDFLTGISPWTSTVGDEGSVEYDGAQQIVILESGDDSGDASIIEQSVSVTTGASLDYVFHFLMVGAARKKKMEMRIGTTSGAEDVVAKAEYEQGWHSIKFSTSATTLYVQFLQDNDGTDEARIAGGVGGSFLYSERARLLEPSGTTGSVTVDALGFSPFTDDDIGRYVRFEYPGEEPGWGVITARASATQVTVQVRREIPRAIPTESWRLGSWSDVTGYPRAMAFYEGRSVLANTDTETRTMWFSQSLDLENMRPDSFVEGGNTVEDDDAMNFTLASPSANDIQWLTALQQLVIGTMGGPWVAQSDGAVLTPSDRTFRQQTTTRIDDATPLLIGNGIVFIDQTRTRIYDIGFQFETNAFVAADLTQLADHIGEIQFEQIDFQQRPDPVVWLRRDAETDDDGQVWALAYHREENIVGWTRLEIGGSYTSHTRGLPVVESMAIIPGANDSTQTYDSGDRDEVWMIVKRTINGSTTRYIEVMEGRYQGPFRESYSSESAWLDAVQADQRHAFYVDSGVTFDTGAKTITNITQADPAVVTSAAHGISDGAEIRITDVIGMTDVNGAKFLVVDGATNTFALTSATDAVTITGATQADPVVISAASHDFSDGDVVGIFDVSGMTEINGRTFTVANKTDDTFELSGEDGTGHTAYTSGGNAYHATDSSGFSTYVSGGSARTTTTTITGLDHLEGETVDVLGDGLVEQGLTVSSGQITTSTAYSYAHVGLRYTSQFESLKLPYGAQRGTALGKPKRVTGFTLVVLDTGKFSVGLVEYDSRTGRLENTTETVDFTRTGTPLGNVTTLSTWEYVLNAHPGAWSTDPRLWIICNLPLPLTILGVGPNIDLHENQAARD